MANTHMGIRSRLLKRLTLIIRNGVIKTVLHPVFPPNESAEQVIPAKLSASLSRWMYAL